MGAGVPNKFPTDEEVEALEDAAHEALLAAVRAFASGDKDKTLLEKAHEATKAADIAAARVAVHKGKSQGSWTFFTAEDEDIYNSLPNPTQ